MEKKLSLDDFNTLNESLQKDIKQEKIFSKFALGSLGVTASSLSLGCISKILQNYDQIKNFADFGCEMFNTLSPLSLCAFLGFTSLWHGAYKKIRKGVVNFVEEKKLNYKNRPDFVNKTINALIDNDYEQL